MNTTGDHDQLDEKRLKIVRANLTPEQLTRLDQKCNALLRMQEIYEVKHEIAIANVIMKDLPGLFETDAIKDIVVAAEFDDQQKRLQADFNARKTSSEDHELKPEHRQEPYDTLKDFVQPETKKEVEQEWAAAAREVTRGRSL